MINLRKQDPIADAVKDILQQEALKGNQTKIDKNHNGKIDGQDFKILRGEKKTVKEEETVDEGVKEVAKKAFKALTGGSDKDQLDALKKRMYKPEPAKKPSDKAMGEEVEIEEGLQQTLRKYVPGYAKRQIDKKMDAEKFGRKDVDKDANFYRYKKVQDKLKKEEVESLDEGKMDKMTLSGLWHKHAQHSHLNDQGYGSGTDSPRHSGHAATAIENHVRKHHGNKVADDMVSHSDHHVAYHEYAGPEEASHHEKEMAKLKKKHGISDKDLHESAPPGFEGTVKAMKKHKDITNPFALAWSMKNKGYKSHKKADGSAKNEEVEVPTQKTLRWFKENAFDYKSPRKPEPNGGSGVKQGSRYGGSKQKDVPEKDTDEKK